MTEPTMFDTFAAWRAERQGKITSSEIYKLLGDGNPFTKGGMTYIFETIAEILTGDSAEAYSKAMEWGASNEFEAILEYQKQTGIEVEYFGVANPKFFAYNEYSGGSPDGIAGDTLIEVKCPYNSGNHVKFLSVQNGEELKKASSEYYYQAQMNLMCTGLDKCTFISYDPRIIDTSHRMATINLYRDETSIALIKERIDAAGEIICDFLNKLI